MQPAYFKKHQRNGIYHYYEVHGGPGKTKDGYQLVVNLLNDSPIISVEHNYEFDRSGLTGTWCTYEVAIPITREEFMAVYNEALEHQGVSIR